MTAPQTQDRALPAPKPGSALEQTLSTRAQENPPVQRKGTLPGTSSGSRLSGYLGIILAGLTVAVPLYFVVITSLKVRADIYTKPISWIPPQWAPQNYSYVWENLDFNNYLVNSIIITVSLVIIEVSLGVLGAEAFAYVDCPAGLHPRSDTISVRLEGNHGITAGDELRIHPTRVTLFDPDSEVNLEYLTS